MSKKLLALKRLKIIITIKPGIYMTKSQKEGDD